MGSKQAEKEELLRMADGQTLMEAVALCKKWGFEPTGDSMALAVQAINCGRLRGEASCMFAHPDLASPDHELVLRPKK